MRITLLGDSICAGYGVRCDRAWATILAKTLGIGLRNAGISGDTAQDGLRRLPALLEQTPDLLYVQFGLNDAWLSLPLSQYIYAMRQILDKALEGGVQTIIVGTNHPVCPTEAQILAEGAAYPKAVTRFNAALRDILAPPGSRLILADIESWIAGLSPAGQALLLQADGVHLSEAGNAFYAQHLEPLFRAASARPASPKNRR